MAGQFLGGIQSTRTIAPTRPLRAVALGMLAAVLLLVILAAASPNGMLPGIAESSIEDDQILIAFEAGDRYFWLPAEAAQELTVATFVGLIPGSQSVTQRSSYNSIDRLAYDEDEKGPDEFVIRPNFLYAVAGVFDDASIAVDAKAGTTGKSFFEDIKTNSNGFIKRMGAFIASVPALTWEDLKHLGADIKAVFFGSESKSEEGADAVHAAAKGFGERVQAHWYVFAGVIALLVFAPFFDVPFTVMGLASALILSTGGFWILAILVAVFGAAMDGRSFLPRSLVDRGQAGVGNLIDDYPRLLAAMGLFAGAGLAAFGLSYFGHSNLAAIVLVVGAIAAGFVIFEGTRVHGFHRLGVGPFVVALAMTAATTVGLWYLGYVGLSWGIFLFMASLILLYAGRRWRDQRRKAVASARAKAQGGVEGVAAFYGDLSRFSRIGLWLLIILAWVDTVAIVAGDALHILALLTVTLLVGFGLFAFLIPRELERRETERVRKGYAVAE